jgi:sarcosine oxidase subunit alpha
MACSVAAGVYLGEVLVASEEGATVVRSRAKVFATGAHDGVLAIPNNDLPGLFSARAIAQLAARGIRPKGKTAIVGEGFWADQAAAALGESAAVRIPSADVAGIQGTSRVRGVVVRGGRGDRSVEVDVVAVAVPGAPSFEVAAQAGAGVRFEALAGYAVNCDDRGRAAEGVWAVGECTGIPFDPIAIEAMAGRLADDVGRALKG